jgi:hypothetical protein
MKLFRRCGQKVIDAINNDGEKTRALIRQMMGAENKAKEAIEMDLDAILAKVQQETTVEASLETLLSQVSAELKAAANDPAKIKAISDQLDSNIAAMTASVTANTDAAPAAS